MASRIAVICLLGLLVASPAIADTDNGIYYQIGFLWPGAYCELNSAGCCMPISPKAPAADFYVSSFNVYDAATDEPKTRCSSNTPFNFTQVSEIRKIRAYWSSIACPSNNGKIVWQSAWKTSGVCSGLDETDYFEAGLALRDKINPLARLVSKQIRPDFGLYSVKAITAAIKAGIRVTPVIQCAEGPFDKYMVYQIFVCVAGDGKTLIECPEPRTSVQCAADEVLFHPFKKWMLKKGDSSSTAGEAFELYGVAMDH